MIDRAILPLKKYIRSIKADMTKVRKDINHIIETFDTDNLKLRSRVDRIEEKLGISN